MASAVRPPSGLDQLINYLTNLINSWLVKTNLMLTGFLLIMTRQYLQQQWLVKPWCLLGSFWSRQDSTYGHSWKLMFNAPIIADNDSTAFFDNLDRTVCFFDVDGKPKLIYGWTATVLFIREGVHSQPCPSIFFLLLISQIKNCSFSRSLLTVSKWRVT